MNKRERFFASVNFRPVDRPPYDLAGTSLTAADSVRVIEGIASALGIAGKYEGGYDKFDERILDALDIDFRRCGNITVPRSGREKSGNGRYTDSFGVVRAWSGVYWDIVDSPLRDASIDDLYRYEFPPVCNLDMNAINDYAARAEDLYNNTGYVVVGEHPVFGVMELGCWMCGFDDFLYRMAGDEDFVHLFFKKALKFQKEIIDVYYGKIGGYIHLTTSGDDFGTQNGSFISRKMFEKLVSPYFKERIEYTKKYTDALYFHHTCGSVYELIPSLIDCGVKILNPIQPNAKNMEPKKLYEAYGGKISFWGGVDTQELLRNGTGGEVETAVRNIASELNAYNGGFILSPAHNLQDDVNPELIPHIYRALKSV